jgi:response regulator RpfG family c-di-GMP phosphodiesterase
MNYILVVDDEADIRDIYEMVLRRAFPLDVVSAESGNMALEIIKSRGKPEVIISDYRMPDGDGLFLYKQITEMELNVPFIICSTDAQLLLKEKFPKVYGYIEKPKIIGPVVEIVDSLVSKTKTPPNYVPVRISSILRWGTANFDLYMKLSEFKFVKVINKDEAFLPADSERFLSKKVQHLYITAQDAGEYIKNFEQNLSLVINSRTKETDISVLTLESMENVNKFAEVLGWTPDVMNAAKHAVNLAVRAVSAEPNILKLVKQKLEDPSSKYAAHVGTLALVTCGFCQQLGWSSESTQMKLGLASLMHDISIDEKKYENITPWNKAASDSQDKKADTLRYKNHPIDAAALIQSMKNVPADVDQIILQHHEKNDGSGFPRGLGQGRITPMACVFILVEDLITFLEDSPDFGENISLFVKLRSSQYNSGNFKKVFDVFKEIVEKSRQPG